MRRYVALLFSLITLASNLLGEISVSPDLSSSSIELHGTTLYTLQLKHPESARFDKESLVSSLSKMFEQAGLALISEDENLTGQRDQQELILTFQLQANKIGHFVIGVPSIAFVLNDGSQQTVYPRFQALQVALPSTADPEDPLQYARGQVPIQQQTLISISTENRREFIDSPDRLQRETERNQELIERRTLPWTLISLLAALLGTAWAGHWLWQTYASKRMVPWRKSAKERALNALHDLAKQGLPERGFYEQYYVEVTLIVRSFIEEEYSIRAPEQTTEEFFASIQEASQFTTDTKELLRNFLQSADLVKFARAKSSRDQCAEAQQAAVRFVAQ